MITERSERAVPKRVVWTPAPARLYGQVPRPNPIWLTSLAAAGMTLIVFVLSLLVLGALLLPGAA